MITIEQYFGEKKADALFHSHAVELLARVNVLLQEAREAGVYRDAIDPDTGSRISGARGGNGDGGFRLTTSKTGAEKSKHKKAKAVDVYDPYDALDAWLDDKILTRHGLYREHPEATRGWCHLQSEPPASGKRTFLPG